MERSKLFGTTKKRETFALIFFTLFVFLPALEFCAFLFERIFSYDEKTLYVVVSVGSIISLFIANQRRSIANILSGPIIGIGIAFGTMWYLDGRVSIYKIELVIPLLIGGLPGIFVYFLCAKFLYKLEKQV